MTKYVQKQKHSDTATTADSYQQSLSATDSDSMLERLKYHFISVIPLVITVSSTDLLR